LGRTNGSFWKTALAKSRLIDRIPARLQEWAYSVEKLENYGGLFFCRKAKHSKLLLALPM
jgi:hypothetical protein